MVKICSLPDCDRRQLARGYCCRHYKKLSKYGDASWRINAQHGEPLAFLRSHISEEGDDCIIWPFSLHPKGYGQVWHESRLTRAHRLMCLLAHGEPQGDRTEAAHSCHMKACINPRHIRWATRSENERDKISNGTYFLGARGGKKHQKEKLS